MTYLTKNERGRVVFADTEEEPKEATYADRAIAEARIRVGQYAPISAASAFVAPRARLGIEPRDPRGRIVAHVGPYADDRFLLDYEDSTATRDLTFAEKKIRFDLRLEADEREDRENTIGGVSFSTLRRRRERERKAR